MREGKGVVDVMERNGFDLFVYFNRGSNLLRDVAAGRIGPQAEGGDVPISSRCNHNNIDQL